MQIAKEQSCANCGSAIDSKYCKQCGQKVIEHKQTIWHLLVHFVSDITHYDGRFIRTLKLLLSRPGFLSSEYKNGVRQKYVAPFKLYLFISAAAYIAFVAFDNAEKTSTKISNPEIIHFIDSTRLVLQKDTAYQDKLDKIRYYTIKDTVYDKKIHIFEVSDMLRHGERHYDSVQNTLPHEKRSKGYKRYKEKKISRIYEIYDTAPYNYLVKTWERIRLIIPKSFLFSMPFFIFGLFLLYYKKRKEYPSAYHAIFTMHFYSMVWIFMTLDSIFSSFFENPATKAIYTYIGYGIIVGCLIYLFVAMFHFYKERWLLTLVKAIILTISTGLIYYCILLVLREYYIINLTSLSA